MGSNRLMILAFSSVLPLLMLPSLFPLKNITFNKGGHRKKEFVAAFGPQVIGRAIKEQYINRFW